MPLDVFGPFRLLHQIGAGPLGPVFRAYDSEENRLVAVKLFQLDSMERAPELVAGLQRIIDAGLTHPVLSAPIAAGIAGPSVYLAQEFVTADSLDTVIREFGPVPPDEAARVAALLAGALDFAAAANIYHGGLHPQDVFLASDDTRLTGVGIVQALEAAGVSPTIRRPYTAAEQISGRQWDRRADVFGLAVVVAEMIGGRRLSGSGARAVQGLLGTTAEADALREVFARALDDDPDQRFATALAFAHALKLATQGSVAAAPAVRPRLPVTEAADELPLANPVSFVAESQVPDDVKAIDAAIGALSDAKSSGSPLPDIDLQVLPPGDSDRDVKERIKELDTLLLKPDAPPRKAAKATPAPKSVGGSDEAQARPAASEGLFNRPPVPARAPAPPIPQSPSAVWPLSLALLVGLIVGIAVGFYVFADRAARATAPARADGSVAPAPPSASTRQPSPPERAARPPDSPAAPAPPQQVSSVPSASPAAAPPNDPRAVRATPPRPASNASRPPESAPDRSSTDRSASRASIAAETPAPANDATGRVLVRSSPAGARVSLDGKDVGATPLTVRSLTFGTHTVRVSRDGYADDERRVVVSASRPSQSLIVELTRSGGADVAESTAGRFKAALIVESRPPGASVYLNGERVGTTPLTLSSVASGSQALRLELDGYRRWTSSIRVVAGESNRVTASLEQ